MVVVRYENGQHRDERDPSFKLRIVCVSVNVHLNSSHRQLLHKHLGLVGRLSHGRDKEATPSEIVFFFFYFSILMSVSSSRAAVYHYIETVQGNSFISTSH
jgi:hypothetical protein